MGYIRLFTDETMDQSEVSYHEFCDRSELDEITECPICKTAVLFEALCDIEGGTENHWLILECPKCHEIIVVKWESPDNIEAFVTIRDIYPTNVRDKVFEAGISNMSPGFISVYNQAHAAESYGLGEIAGMGYRKAMEYLIKDYAIEKHPKEKESILIKTLSSCINEYVTEPKIKAMAKGAVWLGNDETHYVRKWADKDINDMKKLIDLTLYWMNFERMTEEYQQTMKL
ncbi:DUF4145 domain-containing protein [Enterocloster citroniae]|uniref:DUF4145 domain-containing protein n=1 Tax=Enterocloster citroniae TaxID=358743 RepID=A0AA41FGU0_9FIRM|nr:DUF4145 domain-containing protein [Enterocloster citroniae]MBT9811188.1 DUF4145 domain-containing protein [Enterocloster citroniae]